MRLRFNLIKFLFILFFIFLLIVAVYQIYCYFYVSASTEYTTVIECEDTVTVSGYFLRDESVIRAENSKYIDITVNSGEKISKNGIIANVYSTEDSAKIQSQIRELQLRIDEMNSVKLLTAIIRVRLMKMKLKNMLSTYLQIFRKEI